MTDTIADMLTRIRNALVAKHETVDVPASAIKKAIVEILLEEGYIKGYEILEDGIVKTIRIQLKYGPNKQRVIVGIKRISRPGLRVYARKDEIRIMRLVGATKGFIRAPFMVEGLIIGLVGAAIPMGLMVLLYDRAIAYLESKLAILAGLMSFMELEAVMQILIPVAVVLGIGIGFFGSRAAVRKHLKV